MRPLKYANFHREYYPSCVSSCNEYTWNDLRYFCQHNPLCAILSSKLNPLSLLKLEKEYLLFGEYFVRHTLSMSKSSIKTETVSTMTDKTESTELLAQ